MIEASILIRLNLFKYYYSNIFRLEDIILPDTKFRHFRFQLFSKETRFRRLRDILLTRKSLYNIIVRLAPKNAYFTPVKWLNPIYVGKTKKELDVMLSSPLYFDIDMDKLQTPTFSEAKRTANELVKFIWVEYNRTPDRVVFSGHQGFHIYYWDWDSTRILKLAPSERILSFRRNRKKIVDKLAKRGIIVDDQITFDPYRILKIPNTLHGDTGLVAKSILNIETFNPEREARAFDEETYKLVFKINWDAFSD